LKKTYSVLILISILAGFKIGFAKADYYQDIFDDFNNDTNIQVLTNLIVNSTINAIGFNQTDITNPNTEDLTTYTEYEENEGAINQVRVQNATTLYYYSDLFYGAYLAYDFGADFFDDFVCDFDLYVDGAISFGINHHVKFGFYNQLGDRHDMTGNFTELGMNRATSNDYRYVINTNDNGAGFTSGFVTDNTLLKNWQYVRVIKSGTSIKWLVYSDEARTTLWYSYNATTTNDMTFRYFYAMVTYDFNNYANTIIYGWVKNINGLTYTGAYEGQFFSVNYMNAITDDATALLYETDLEGFNTIYLEVSDDNSTWIKPTNCNNGTGAMNLEGLNLDDLYVRGNFTRPLGSGKCDLDSLKIIYESTCSGSGTPTTPLFLHWIVWVLLVLGITIIIATRRKFI